jgi:hypothetical protein
LCGVTHIDARTGWIGWAVQSINQSNRIACWSGPIFSAIRTTTAICGDLHAVIVDLAFGDFGLCAGTLVHEAARLVAHKAKATGPIGLDRRADHHTFAGIAGCFDCGADAGGRLAIDGITASVVAFSGGSGKTWAFTAR